MKDGRHPYDSFYESLEPVLSSKIDEFVLIGYGKITKKELWEYLTKKKWKKPEPGIRLHQLVHEVLTIKTSDYMTFATVEAYRSPNWFTELDQEELQELLHPNGK
ncbi:post-transcriptional regulator [Falsibacillus albus]|uniref:Competence protein ComN n=1 Tax=Falsibacillus albus TaxID=2478915 RepID=A0A3L7K5H4_9BACI|nr:post-transcriptional regulator [Falsibacillus albus]RLQ98090.1 competence protein ComN [Falsibacillus albus]